MEHRNEHDSAMDANNMFMFACGAIAGAAVALMFAPARGRETREFLAERSRRVKDMGREMLNEHGERFSTAVERGRESAIHFGERISQAVEHGKSGYREAVRQGSKLASNAMQDAEDIGRTVRNESPT
jgi:gas vesicle protein